MNINPESVTHTMAKNLKKFVNPKFTRTVGLEPLRRLLERHRDALAGLDLAIFDGAPEAARTAVQDFFAGPEDAYPEGLVADLHRIAELGNAEGLRLLLEQARREGISIVPERGTDGAEEQQDPKHVALSVFLDHPRLFDAAADMLALTARTSLAEFSGVAEGVEAQLDERARTSFEQAAAEMFEADLHGRYCRVGWYEDADEINLVVTYGSTITTTPVVEEGAERVISYRAAEHAVLSYSAVDGRLKIGGVGKARRAELAEIFARTMLGRPGFFASPSAQQLYTLAPIERAGFRFQLTHAFDPQIRQVQIIEVQANRVITDPETGEERVQRSLVSRHGKGDALGWLGESQQDISFGTDAWRLSHVVLRVHFDVGERRPARVTVKLKPPAQAMFKRQRFEGQIMELLRRNGFCHDRDAQRALIAAE